MGSVGRIFLNVFLFEFFENIFLENLEKKFTGGGAGLERVGRVTVLPPVFH